MRKTFLRVISATAVRVAAMAAGAQSLPQTVRIWSQACR